METNATEQFMKALAGARTDSKRIRLVGGAAFMLTPEQCDRVDALTDEQRAEFVDRAKQTPAYRGRTSLVTKALRLTATGDIKQLDEERDYSDGS